MATRASGNNDSDDSGDSSGDSSDGGESGERRNRDPGEHKSDESIEGQETAGRGTEGSKTKTRRLTERGYARLHLFPVRVVAGCTRLTCV